MEKVIVCISSYYKGYDFMVACKEIGNKVILITSESLRNEKWPWDSIDEVYYMPEEKPYQWNMDNFLLGFSYLMKIHEIDAVIALDDFDVEKGALVRETFRIPGMGQTTHRYFRDKLAMRQKAKDSGISIPEFTSIFNDAKLKRFVEEVPGPWVLKPRSEASATGIKKINNQEELWEVLEKVGDERYKYLLESFKPGNVYHVDCLVYEGKIIFTCCSKYLATPMKVSHEGGVFRTITLDKKSEEAKGLEKINQEVLSNFGILHGATHSEYIRGENGQFYFLETSSRVGGAHIPDMVEAATGVNIWKEWAKLEDAVLRGKKYSVKETKKLYGGLVVSLAKEIHPDTSKFECEEVEKFIPKDYHIGIVYKSKKQETVVAKLEEAVEIITREILQILPPKDKPTN